MKHLAFTLAACLLALPLAAQSPPRAAPEGARKPAAARPAQPLELTLEWREVEEDEAGYSVSTKPSRPLLTQQQVRVRSGETASLVLAQSVPMHWLQSVQAQSAALAASGVSASLSGAGVTQGLAWLQAGQSLRLAPRWSGASEPVTVELELEASSLGERAGAELPARAQRRVATTLTLTPGQWVTFAASGARAQPGVYGSAAAQERRRLLQMRWLPAP